MAGSTKTGGVLQVRLVQEWNRADKSCISAGSPRHVKPPRKFTDRLQGPGPGVEASTIMKWSSRHLLIRMISQITFKKIGHYSRLARSSWKSENDVRTDGAKPVSPHKLKPTPAGVGPRKFKQPTRTKMDQNLHEVQLPCNLGQLGILPLTSRILLVIEECNREKKTLTAVELAWCILEIQRLPI